MKNKRQENLFEKFLENIDVAWDELKRHPNKQTRGFDKVSIEDFQKSETDNLNLLKKHLIGGFFSFSKLKPVYIDDGRREILIACTKDRIVSKAILKTIVPKFTKYATNSSYCPIIPIKKESEATALAGVPLAAKKIQELMGEGYIYVFETDIKKFFNNINKKLILKKIEKEIKDLKLKKLIRQIINYQIHESNDIEERSLDIGLAQGSPLSPLFANIYLYEFDKKIKGLSDVVMVRYVDDLVIHCKEKARAYQLYQIVKDELANLGLEIHEINKRNEKGDIKTTVTNVKEGPLFFLGLKFNFTKIGIPKKKKDGKMLEIEKILKRRVGLLEKTQAIRTRLDGFIRQYRYPHYSAENDIEGLVNKAQRALKNYYSTAHYSIFKQNPFAGGVKQEKIDQFFKFIGIDLNYLKKP